MRSWFGENFASVGLITFFLLLVLGLSAFSSWDENGRRSFGGEISDSTICEGLKKLDTANEALSGVNVPQDATSDCAPTDLPQMGSLTYYRVGMATPTEFYNSVNGRGFNEGYGLQCVAAFKQFTFSLSGKYVAAAGGGAKGYATQQGQIEPLGFKWHAGSAGLQDGDWGIWTNGQYGHVAMFYQGKWFSQNQYAANPNAGNAFNLASISTNGLAGYYRPNIYINAPAPSPAPAPQPKPSEGKPTESVSTAQTSYVVRRGDTLGGISLSLGWWPGVSGLYGDSGYAQRLADFNGISPRGMIYPNTVINQSK